MTDEQKKWFEIKMVTIYAKPVYFMKEPLQRWRLPFYKLSVSSKFDKFIIGVLIANTFVYCLTWRGSSKEFDDAIELINAIFA